ncbi:coiled-coil domain-containing protein 91 isoform X1 [Callorhinchus milii]|uniref:Coiled-coil domain-containing protein 91 n=2 Tax=Callorhinchus milii TaxID=7868 RepID=A0A4W3JEL8_CALMI|nr:coiled-coil domain-containing protein 91 isoform X1 [Callorhinchus milii]XP_007903312.1 coiled-coil domain-containing protein 91 isoform X1 [Callorhinchus milii]XP_042191306.1 coiled-coil domain-containing protein 91 isoform X1 [Callorhinchus milii]|eukprot:gi/632973763/ref/XP_007903311.1/ PREDICTED: coiled-coil domain-containing protein 91 isoform X1 [Callorhinchus milii]
MDDDDFGGFEAAESFEDGEAGMHSVSPAIPWAAFSAVPGMQLTQSAPPDILLDQTTQSVTSYQSKFALCPGDEPNSISKPGSAGNNEEQTTLIAQIQPKPQSLLDTVGVPASSLEEERLGQPASIPDDDAETARVKEMEAKLKETLQNVETKLSAAEEEKLEIKKELAELLEKHSKLQEGILQEKGEAERSHREYYSQLQDKHKQELEDLRKAGHIALNIIVEEFKALMKVTMLEQQETSGKHLQSAIEKQARECEELLNAQHQRLLDMLDEEKVTLQDRVKEALVEQTQEHKEILEKGLVEERQRSKETVEAIMKEEKEIIKEAVLKAVQEERERMEKIQSEQRELWEAEHRKDQEKLEQVIQQALAEERSKSKEVTREAIRQERRSSENAIQEAVQKAREDLLEYTKEQKRLDHVIRQRNLSSLSLFLSCAQNQLSGLMENQLVTEEREDK